MNFYNKYTKKISTPAMLTNIKDITNLESMRKKGYYPVVNNSDDIDNLFEKYGDVSYTIDENNKTYVETYKIITLPISEIKDNIKQHISKTRKLKEALGVTLPTGTQIATAIEDQNRLTSTLRGMEEAGLQEVDFKSASGWIKLSFTELKQISVIVTLYIEKCFASERKLSDLCDNANTIEELKQIIQDEPNMWPNTVITIEELRLINESISANSAS